MSEALQLYLDFGFRKAKLHRIYASVYAYNSRSQKLLEKAGFILEGRFRKSKKVGNRWTDLLVYAMLNEDYRSAGRRRTAM